MNRITRIYIAPDYASSTADRETVREEAIQEIRGAAGRKFGGCTVLRADGAWEDDFEPSIVVEIFHDASRTAAVRTFAKDWGFRWHQDAVGIVTLDAAVEFGCCCGCRP
jgi:hypothetical protein